VKYKSALFIPAKNYANVFTSCTERSSKPPGAFYRLSFVGEYKIMMILGSINLLSMGRFDGAAPNFLMHPSILVFSLFIY
jgi:hypothetical protein